jgi:hypothetical protein
MRKGSNKVNVGGLKGLQLYNYIFNEVSKVNKGQKSKKQISQDSKRKTASILYNKFKSSGKYNSRIIKSEIRTSLSGLPPKEVCNPLYLSRFQIQDIEYYQIDDHLRSILPDCLDVKLNAGSLGYTRIFNTRSYTYYTNGVKRIVENIRQHLESNRSGEAFFNGVVRLKRGRKNNGAGENYYVEFFLYINDVPFEDRDAEDVEYQLSEKRQRIKETISRDLAKRVSSLKQKKKRAKLEKERSRPASEKIVILRKEIKAKKAAIKKEQTRLKQLFLAGIISKSVFKKEQLSLDQRLLEIKNTFKS